MGQEKRNAVELKSGNAVDHSAPVLSQPTGPVTAGRKPEASLVSAKSGREFEGGTLIGGTAAVPFDSDVTDKLKDAADSAPIRSAKSGREFEGGTLIGGTAAVPFSSLDSKKNNRDKSDDVSRKPGCGTMTLRGVSADTSKFVRSTCKCWDCPRCAPRKANRYRKAIGRIAEEHKLNILLTLTLDPKKLRGEDSTRYINRIFAHFRTYLKRELHESPLYIRILEHQKNGNAHLHILLNRRIKQRWIADAWSALGGGNVVDIRRVTMHRVSHYLSKYLTKQMLLSAPKRTRRVTTSRGIKLNPKTASDRKWEHINFPINRLHDIYWKTAENVSYDAEGKVTSFDLPNDAAFPLGSGSNPQSATVHL